MLRRTVRRLIGHEDDVFISAIKDPAFLKARLASLGTPDTGIKKVKPEDVDRKDFDGQGGKMTDTSSFTGGLLTQDEVQRFTCAPHSPEYLLNKRVGAVPDVGIVDEATGNVKGSVLPDPTRYGDWEIAGRCYDF
jgi:hypothetical protein